jgi:hypothetical protein
MKNNSTVPQTLKKCSLCKYAPVIFFVLLDFIISMYGLSHYFICIYAELLIGSLYVKNYAYQEGKNLKETIKQTEISTIMLCLMIGIVIRDTLVHYLLS